MRGLGLRYVRRAPIVGGTRGGASMFGTSEGGLSELFASNRQLGLRGDSEGLDEQQAVARPEQLPS